MIDLKINRRHSKFKYIRRGAWSQWRSKGGGATRALALGAN